MLNAEAPNRYNGGLGGGSDMVTGDIHLTSIATNPVRDGSILQFDFHPYAETVSFDFIFVSEEYPDYSNSNVNDAFGFFVFEQGDPTNFTNIALFPNGNLVTINNSNWGNTGINTAVGLPSPLFDAVNSQWRADVYAENF